MEIRVEDDNPEALLRNPFVAGLLEAVSDGVLVIDARDRHIVAMNPKARELLGYERDEVLGCQCKEMMNSPACTLACPLTALMEGRDEGSELDLYYRGRSGVQLLHAQTRMILVNGPDGEPIAGIELFSDLTRVRHLEKTLRERTSLGGIVGRSAAMRALFDTVDQVAPYDIPIVITGESGVGKELFASAIHYNSPRADKPYLQINCATLSPELTASELFGHRRGAFTGASTDRKGFFEEAHGGTLLLDEVGELSPEIQAKLLRVLQDGEIQRLGEDRSRKVDVRILAATNRSLELEVEEGRFRDDLYYRLMGASLHIPPLRERKEDVPLLAEYFAAKLSKELGRPVTLSRDALAELVKRDWPGNGRELLSRLRLAAIKSATGHVRPEHLEPDRVPRRKRRVAGVVPLAELEARAIEDAMRETGGNAAEAARLLGIDRTTLWRKLKRRARA